VAEVRGSRLAFGSPGIEPRWARAAKEGVGTAYSTSSRIWFTIWNGIVTEVYYPTVDRPQTRDLQFLVSDGSSFFHEEKRHLRSHVERISHTALGYRVVSEDPDGRYSITKELITDPHSPCLLQRVKLAGKAEVLRNLDLYVLCAPHLAGGGAHNNAFVVETAGRQILAAERKGTWLMLAADAPFRRASCGYAGASDGWTDVSSDFVMDWEFDQAPDGNVALTGLLDLNGSREFTVGLAFGDSQHGALTTLLQALDVPFSDHQRRFVAQWRRATEDIEPLGEAAGDGGKLYKSSYSQLVAHEDKTYQGALIASMSIPWGEARGDDDAVGYHLVWTRDMVNSSLGMLAAGNVDSPLRALTFLAVSQRPDGGFPQNFWLNGEPHWHGVQLDQVAFPIILAWRLRQHAALRGFDPYPMVARAAGYLIANGPATQQERWEEASGYSPSTLASNIAALICAAEMMRARGDASTARFVEEYADFLEANVERWTVTSDGTLLPDVKRHYIRIHPVDIGEPSPDEDPDHGTLIIANRPPGKQAHFPSKEIVDPGFLELVRYGIRRAGDALIEDSLRVVDAELKVDTPFGPCWHRYSHDGYGQRDDGGPYMGWGKGRAWPLLTGERGHYELAAGENVWPLIAAMEHFASPTGLLPEQIWDCLDRPDIHMYMGKPTGAAMPLMWAHSEYIRLLRSTRDGQVFDLIPPVVDRYLGKRQSSPAPEVWKFNRQARSVPASSKLRIMAKSGFTLRWSADGWTTAHEGQSTSTMFGIHYADIPPQRGKASRIVFTFRWHEGLRWEGRDYAVGVSEPRRVSLEAVRPPGTSIAA
jgi:glucoamylase